MKQILKKFRRLRELKKKEQTGFTPLEELKLLRLQQRRSDNAFLDKLCLKIKKRYFFCAVQKIFNTSYICQTDKIQDIISLLNSGDEKIILHYRQAAEWNYFLTKLSQTYESYIQECHFENVEQASKCNYVEERQHFHFSEKFNILFNEIEARKRVEKFLPTTEIWNSIVSLNLTAAQETYRLLLQKTQTVWLTVYKEEFPT